MSAGENDFTIEQGDDFNKVITWTADGVAVDLTGYVVSLKAAIRQTSDALSININTTDDPGSIAITDASAGEVTISIPGSVSAEYTFFNVVFQLRATSASDVRVRTIEGEITLAREVS